MVAMQSTNSDYTAFQWAGGSATTSDPVIMAQIQRIGDLLVLWLMQANYLIMEFRVLVINLNILAERVIDTWNAADIGIEAMIEASGIIAQAWLTIPEVWGMWWFKKAWNYA